MTLLALSLALAPQASAQHAGAFSRVGFGARGIGMGNALAADIFSGTSPYYNPAHAPLLPGQHLEASVAGMSYDRSLQFLQLGAPLQEKAGFAVGIIHASVSDIDGRNNSGFHTGNLSVDEYAGFLSFGLRFSERLSGGISLQFFRTDLYEGLTPARTIGIDVGLSARIRENWAVAIVADDLLARYSWDSSDIVSGGRSVTDSFPRRVRLGVMHRSMGGALRLALETESRWSTVDVESRVTRLLGDTPIETVQTISLTTQDFRVRAGAEYDPLPGFTVRAGIEQLGEGVLDAVRPSVGFSVEQVIGSLRLRADYAFAYEARAAGKLNLLTLRLFL